MIVGHDWGAPVAWNAALWRPDIFRAVAALSVPFSDRSPIAPTAGMRAMFGDNFFYILYFQQPGVAEHELQTRRASQTLRRLLFGGSGNAPDRGINGMVLTPPPKTAYFLDQLADTDVLPPWLTEADLDLLHGRIHARAVSAAASTGTATWTARGRCRRRSRARRSSSPRSSSAATAT